MQSSFRPLLLTALMVAVGITLGALGVVAIGRFVGPLPLAVTQTTTQKQSTFDVSGEGKVTTVPDKAVVSLGITVSESTVKQAQDKANGVINTINTELGKLGIEKKDIKTENYSLYPNYDYQGVQRIVGYNVNANLSVSLTDFTKLNQAIDAATAAGANQVGGISFTLSDDKKKSVEDEARKQAIDDAKAKAQALASLSGMKLGRIVNVMEQAGNGVYPMPMYAKDVALESARGGAMAAGVPTNTEPGSTTYSYTVTLSYETF